jgi:hypothetical protein
VNDQKRLEKWLKICAPGLSIKNGYLCSKHFYKSQFLLTPRQRFLKLNIGTAVPISPAHENHHESPGIHIAVVYH